jgi:hypothetical protein
MSNFESLKLDLLDKESEFEMSLLNYDIKYKEYITALGDSETVKDNAYTAELYDNLLDMQDDLVMKSNQIKGLIYRIMTYQSKFNPEMQKRNEALLKIDNALASKSIELAKHKQQLLDLEGSVDNGKKQINYSNTRYIFLLFVTIFIIFVMIVSFASPQETSLEMITLILILLVILYIILKPVYYKLVDIKDGKYEVGSKFLSTIDINKK